MTAVSKPIKPIVIQKRLRPFDVHRDLVEVADLVELCFAETLDPEGRDYLARMRAAAKESSIFRMAKSYASLPMTGYIWQEGGRVVGNVTLIPYLHRGRRTYLIANVAVHPDFRRRGIARRMTEAAVEYCRAKSASTIWLHVREENQAALDLYKSLGFQPRAVRTTWHGNPDSRPEVPLRREMRVIRPSRSHWKLMSSWLNLCYPSELSWHMPIQLNDLHPGWTGVFWRFLRNTYVHEWGLTWMGEFKAAAAWQPANNRTNAVWLAAPLEGAEESVQALLAYILGHTPTCRPLSIEYPAGRNTEAIREAGFSARLTLVWMKRKLSPS